MRSMASSCEFYSHKGIHLKKHLEEVGHLCKAFFERCKVEDKSLIEISELIGKCHDIGKYTEFFQSHLINPKRKRELTKHSPLSAIFAAWLVNEKFRNEHLTLLAYLPVRFHHSDLRNINEFVLNLGDREDKKFILRDQIFSIKKNIEKIDNELKSIGIDTFREFVENFECIYERVKNVLKTAMFHLNKKDYWSNYFMILLLLSSLIDSDRRDASKLYENVPKLNISYELKPNIIERYKELKLRKNVPLDAKKINQLREKLFDAVKNSISSIEGCSIISNSKRVFTITAPTGLGKTLIGTYVALKLKEKLEKESRNVKIIYSLPYINIIEQTYSLFENVLKFSFPFLQKDNKDLPISLLLKYHHLFLGYVKDETEPLDKILMLAESFDSEIIVTTFNQIWYSFVKCENSTLKKFHNIANSIIILDEIQAFPLEYWSIIKDILTNFAIKFNTYIIFMTATMPILFKSDETYELIPNYKDYYQELNRNRYHINIEKEMDVDEFTEFFIKKWKGDGSALIVLNTIKTSIDVYYKLKERLKSEQVKESEVNHTEPILMYLSTNVIPKVRAERVKMINEHLKNKRKVILVSTQAVEAGVDLDFDIAFRDLGPLDSIIQVAGRCNRNWRRESGEYYIVKIMRNNQSDSEKIYGQLLMDIITKILKDKAEITESELPKLIEEYYNEIVKRLGLKENDRTKEIRENIEKLKFEELKNSEDLFEMPKISIFIELDEEASNIINKFKDKIREIIKIKEKGDLERLFKYKAELKMLQAKLEEYIVDTWEERVPKGIENIKVENISFDIKYIPRNLVDAYYNEDTGLKFYESTQCGKVEIW